MLALATSKEKTFTFHTSLEELNKETPFEW
jgi:hypothetical protein